LAARHHASSRATSSALRTSACLAGARVSVTSTEP
jgi:hypothetical protein